MWTISAGMHAGVLRINILPAARAWGRGGGRGHGGVGWGGGGGGPGWRAYVAP